MDPLPHNLADHCQKSRCARAALGYDSVQVGHTSI
jgi:hypothetical protein